MAQKHDIGHQKRRKAGNYRIETDCGALARSLVDRGLCTPFILQGRKK